MIIGISIPWYETTCSYSTAVNTTPKNTWFVVKRTRGVNIYDR